MSEDTHGFITAMRELLLRPVTITDRDLLEAARVFNETILQFFRFEHVAPRAGRAVSLLFAELAIAVVCASPRNEERSCALRKLLEGKDAALRAALMDV